MSEDTNIVKKTAVNLRKAILIVTGSFFVGLGVLGIFLPLLPATPFFLLAAACYVRSSQRFYDWLLNNRMIGGYIKDYRERGGMRLKVKIWAIALLWASILYTTIFVTESILAKTVMVTIAVCTSAYILSIKTVK
jgi:hypothetical protein